MIRAEDLRAAYGKTQVLHGVSAEFRPGELWGVIGPNGSGKTTLLRLLARLARPAGGTLTLEGVAYDRWPRRAFAQKVALLPQQQDAPAVTVRELAAYGRYPYQTFGYGPSAADREAVERALLRAGAAELADRDVRTLSGGQRQRARLAMTLAQDAQVLLLDEPTTWLDPGGQFAVMELLRELAGEGRCVVAVLHDLNLALSCCGRLAVLEAGRLRGVGEPAALAERGLLDAVFGVRCVPSGEGWLLLPERKR